MSKKQKPLTFDELADIYDKDKCTRGTPARCLPMHFVLDWARDKSPLVRYDAKKDLFFRVL